MVYINEWLPNPEGKDADGEFVELFNSGSEAVNVSGWSLKANSKTKFSLSGQIEVGDFLVFKKPGLKISLVNTDGEISLFDAGGKLVDRQRFLGLAQEGKSFSKTIRDFSTKNLGWQGKSFGEFVFSEPTPGEQNRFLEQTALVNNIYPTGVPLNARVGVFDFVLLTLGVAAVLTGLTVFVLKRNEDLSQLFFGRDEEVWR